MGSGKGGGDEVTIGHHYGANMLLSFGHTPPRQIIHEVRFGGREAWKGDFEGAGSIAIEKKNLFKGEAGEGGVSGVIDIMPGGADQPVNPSLLQAVTDELGRTYTPAYRRLTCLFLKGFSGVDLSGTDWNSVSTSDGVKSHSSLVQSVFSSAASFIKSKVKAFNSFYWSAMNPYYKLPSVRKTDIWDQWYPEKALLNGYHNFIHIIREAMVNVTWGRGFPVADINDVNWRAAADRLYDEGLVGGMIWSGQSQVEDFIEMLLEHIEANLIENRVTGLWEIVLIRPPDDEESLYEFNPSNCELLDFDCRAGGKVVNELVVKYTRPEDGAEDSIVVHDLAGRVSQGRPESQTRNYPAIQDPDLAARLGQRDLATLRANLKRIRLKSDRGAFALYPGNAARLNWPPLGIDLIIRLGKMDLGNLVNGAITIDALEDVFGLPDTSFVAAPETGWVNPNLEPEPVSSYKLYEASYYELITSTSSADRADWPTDVGFASVVALAPNSDAESFDLYDDITGRVVSSGDFSPTGLLQTDVSPLGSNIQLDPAYLKRVGALQAGGFAWLEDELVYITGFDYATFTLNALRGVLDTIPAAHSAGTRIWVYGASENGVDPTLREEFEDVDFRLLTKTSLGALEPGSAPVISYQMMNRWQRPYPPGNVRINTGYFPASTSGPAVLFEWSHRNKEQQTAYAPYWTEASVTPPGGVQYRLRLSDQAGVVVDTTLTADNYEYTLAGTETELRCELWAVEGGVESWRKFDHTVSIV